jgi:subtilisin family serine protease
VTTGKFRRVDEPIPGHYIVVLNDDTATSEIVPIVADLASTHGGTVNQIYRYALKGFSIQALSEDAAKIVSRDPRVEFVEEDGRGFVTDTQFNAPWALDRIDQRNLPLNGSYSYSRRGNGVTVYVLDSGIRTTHQEFGGRASFAADFVGDGQNGADCEGHGTSVAAVAGGVTYGVAKNVSLKNVRVCDCFGICPTSAVISGVDWVTGNHAKPAVANMSLAVSPSTALDKAVRKSLAAGVTYAVAAGNQNIDASMKSPARVTEIMTVGATDISDNRWQDNSSVGSNFGTVLDLFAPGKDVLSAFAWADYPFNTIPSDTATLVQTGTSFASPHVAGAAAQYLEGDPTGCPSTVSQVIIDNATGGVVVNPGTGSPNRLLFVPFTWPSPTYYSLSLNGTNAYIDAPNAGMGVSLDVTGPITLEAWIKLNTNTVEQSIMRRSGTTDGGYALKIMG